MGTIAGAAAMASCLIIVSQETKRETGKSNGLSVSSAFSAAVASDKCLGSGENVADQFGGRRLDIHPQQGLCAGYAKQAPGFRAVAVLRCVEEELYPVQPFLLQNGIVAKAFGPSGACPQDG